VWLNPEDYMISPEMLPSADISAFLASHRAFVHLALRSTDLPNELPSFPHLRSFEGSFENSAIICGAIRRSEHFQSFLFLLTGPMTLFSPRLMLAYRQIKFMRLVDQ
jgi:hypothetical protein